MNARTGLTRLAVLYGLVEQLRSLEFRTAAAAMDEAARAVVEEAGFMEEEARHRRAALYRGDREGWSVAETTREVAERRILQLAELRAERKKASDEAQEGYLASRVRSEQLKRVVENEEATRAYRADRQMQALSDDRYASRMTWERMHGQNVLDESSLMQ